MYEEAIGLLAEISLPYKDHDHGLKLEEARKLALDALRTAQQHENPLTLEELKERDGKPVYVKAKQPKDRAMSGWRIVEHDLFDDSWLLHGANGFLDLYFENTRFEFNFYDHEPVSTAPENG